MTAVKPSALNGSSVFILLIILVILINPLLLADGQLLAATIVLDPGHGGGDHGAGAGGKFSEKQFTLSLAREIGDRLTERHRVELTRTSDIALTPAERAAVANHLQADVMISLHAAVAPYCGDRVAAIYYHDDERLSRSSGTSIQDVLIESDLSQPAWAGLQNRHSHQSQYLATTIKESLSHSPTFDRVTVSGVPLASLMGADLPAILLEVGCIHAPATPDSQMRDQQLNRYAASIAAAIEMVLPGLERGD